MNNEDIINSFRTIIEDDTILEYGNMSKEDVNLIKELMVLIVETYTAEIWARIIGSGLSPKSDEDWLLNFCKERGINQKTASLLASYWNYVRLMFMRENSVKILDSIFSIH